MAEEEGAAATAEENAAGNGAAATDDDLAAILKDAQNPDAVKNAINRQKEEAKTARQKAADLEAKLKEYEDRDKSDQQKLEEKATTAEGRATTAETKLLRYEVAAEKKLPLDLAEFLTGSSKEEVEKAADKLLERIGEQRPTPDFGSGARESATDVNDMDAAIRRAAGR